jgi:hypothetical protein
MLLIGLVSFLMGGLSGFIICPRREISIREIEERLSELNTAELLHLVDRLKKSWEVPEQPRPSNENSLP